MSCLVGVKAFVCEEMLEPFKSGQAEIGVKATHIVPILPKESFGSYWFDDARRNAAVHLN